jgi:hypothetical protein
MIDYFKLKQQDQLDILDMVQAAVGISQEVAEKDIWLCWALEALFRMPAALPMAFKGGTSLSKVYSAIHRVSEDIDISIDIRSFVALPEDVGKLSRSQADKLRDQVIARLKEHTNTQVLPWLEGEAEARFGPGIVQCHLDPKGEGLSIRYPSAITDPLGYLRPGILLEFGGRNVTDPFETHLVQPYAAGLGLEVAFPGSQVRVLSPRRTFWEKATLIHVECRKPRDRATGKHERMSRHWSDLANLADHEIGTKAIRDRGLAESVVTHKGVFFRDKDADYPACLNGGWVLVPPDHRCSELETDFRRMVDAGMFYGVKPEFGSILGRLASLQDEINGRMNHG